MNTTTRTAKELHASTAENLNRLIAVCKDGEAGFRAAADEIKDIELKEVFTRLARQRAEFTSELQLCVRNLDCEPRDSTTLSGALHRGWMSLKSDVGKNDAHAVLAECERGEDEAVAAYREVLADAPLESTLRLLVSNQSAAVQAAHDEVRDLRDSPVYASEKN